MTVFAPFLARFGSELRIVFKVPTAMLAPFTPGFCCSFTGFGKVAGTATMVCHY